MTDNKIEIRHGELRDMDWANDALFFTHEFEDETSQFDPNARWCPGLDCYQCTHRVRVPIAFRDCDDLIEVFIEWMLNNHPEAEGFYVAPEAQCP